MMKLKQISYLLLSLFVFLSCEDKKTNTLDYVDPSDDAQIYSLSVKGTHSLAGDSATRAKDSINFLILNKTTFAIDQLTNVIYNVDPLPYGMKIGKLNLALTHNSSYNVSKVEILSPDSPEYKEWNKTDSINFSSNEISINVHAPSGYQKKYTVKLLIYQADPDSISWTKMQDITTPPIDQQKVLLVNQVLYSYSIHSNVLSLNTAASTGSFNWEAKNLYGLPSSVDMASFNYFNGQFVAITTNGDFYVSTDGENWTQQATGMYIAAIYGTTTATDATGSSKEVLLLAIKENDGDYSFGTTADLLTITREAAIEAGFPIKGFSSVFDNEKKSKFLVLVGGKDKASVELNSTWLLRKTAKGLELSPSTKNSFFAGEGLSAFYYADMLYVLSKNQFYTSRSWGEVWEKAPTKQNPSPAIAGRTNQSVVVDAKNNIWLIGGIATSTNQALNDAWRGRLNKLN